MLLRSQRSVLSRCHRVETYADASRSYFQGPVYCWAAREISEEDLDPESIPHMKMINWQGSRLGALPHDGNAMIRQPLHFRVVYTDVCRTVQSAQTPSRHAESSAISNHCHYLRGAKQGSPRLIRQTCQSAVYPCLLQLSFQRQYFGRTSNACWTLIHRQ